MPPPGQPGYGPPPGGPTPKGPKPSPISLRGPLSIVLIAVIVVSLVAGGLLAAELYARDTANSRVAASAECVVGDKVTVSFGLKPLLLQHMTSDYGPISIITAGNQIRGAKGMKAEVEIDNVHLDGNDQSKGTIGVLDAAVTWPSNGVTRSVQDAIPLCAASCRERERTRRTARSNCAARWAAASSSSRRSSTTRFRCRWSVSPRSA